MGTHPIFESDFDCLTEIMARETKLYKALGLKSTASADEIKKAYRKLIIQFHPDKNPDGADRFKEIQHAYSILSDEKQKQLYDRVGEKNMQKADNAAGMKRPKGRDVVHQLRASLEELYNGTKKKLSLNRKELCPKCDGQGGTGTEVKCKACQGRGTTVRMLPGGQMLQM